jgi:hypothetical protein
VRLHLSEPTPLELVPSLRSSSPNPAWQLNDTSSIAWAAPTDTTARQWALKVVRVVSRAASFPPPRTPTRPSRISPPYTSRSSNPTTCIPQVKEKSSTTRSTRPQQHPPTSYPTVPGLPRNRMLRNLPSIHHSAHSTPEPCVELTNERHLLPAPAGPLVPLCARRALQSLPPRCTLVSHSPDGPPLIQRTPDRSEERFQMVCDLSRWWVIQLGTGAGLGGR